jgi:hypothetical protein
VKLEILKRNWYKRRVPEQKDDNISSVEVIGYEQTHNHFCKLKVTYSNSDVVEYISRVVYNEIKDYWTVDGMHVAVRVL